MDMHLANILGGRRLRIAEVHGLQGVGQLLEDVALA